MSLGIKADIVTQFTIRPVFDKLKFHTAQRSKTQPGSHEIIPVVEEDFEDVKELIFDAIGHVAQQIGKVNNDHSSGAGAFVTDIEDEMNLALENLEQNSDTGQIMKKSTAFRYMFQAVTAYTIYLWLESLGMYDESRYWEQKCDKEIRNYRNRSINLKNIKNIRPVNL